MARRQTQKQMIQRGLNSSLIGIGFNFVLALVKCTTGFIGHSFALVADGIESLSDVISSAVVYVGLRLSIKPPDEDHPYGHGKAEPVAAIIVSLALIVAAIVIGVESIVRIQTPHPIPEAYTLWVLFAVVGIKVLLSRYVSSVGEEIDSTAARSDAWHHLSDAITSAFAFVGISIALWTRNAAADDWAALCASPIIILNAWRQLRAPSQNYSIRHLPPSWNRRCAPFPQPLEESSAWKNATSAKSAFATMSTCISSSKEL
jgi:cation diffusion facilitator family transporter